jgi:Fe2+ transport system protein FeoA
MTLDKAKRGQRVIIKNIPNNEIRVQAIRLGLYEGAKIDCSAKIPFGPIILSNRMQEIAIGRHLAKNITIELEEVKEGAGWIAATDLK